MVVLSPESGREISRIKGNIHTVCHESLEITKDHIVLHNHVRDMTFSGQDLAASAEQDAYMAVVVTSRTLYFVKRPPEGWPNAGGIYFDTMLHAMLGDGDLNNDNWHRHSIMQELTDQIDADYWYITNWKRKNGL
jgi:hypothetical protein